MEAAGVSKNAGTYLPNYISYIPEDRNAHSHHNEKLESHTVSPYCKYPYVTEKGGKFKIFCEVCFNFVMAGLSHLGIGRSVFG